MPIRRLKQRLDEKYRGLVIVTLILLGIITLVVRFFLSTGEGVPHNDKIFILTYDASFKSVDSKSLIRLSPPLDTDNAFIIAQSIENRGLRLLRNSKNKESLRDIVALATSPGNKRLIAEFSVHISPLNHKKLSLTTLTLSTKQRELYLSNSIGIEIDSTEVMEVVKKLTAENHERLIEVIFKYVHQNIIRDNTASNDDATSVLRSRKADALGRARAMVALCRASKIPARIITGFILKEGFDIEPHYWVETHDDSQWIPYDPENGYYGELPFDFLPVRKGGSSIIGESSVEDISISFDVTEQYVPVGQLGGEVKGIMGILDLTRLSFDTRSTIAMLLLLPLGALFTTFCTNIIGIRTYGTFTPTLLALATIYADWITTLVIFLTIAITGLLGRYVMPDKLSRIPRLTIVFTVVAMSMTLGVSIMDYFSLTPAGHVMLVPIIILTSLIDRLYKSLDEDGVRIAMTRFGWTAAVGVGCYFILFQERIGHLLLAYPEIHMFTLVMVLFLSDYKYNKLSDTYWFNWIAEPRNVKSVKSKEILNTETQAPKVSAQSSLQDVEK